MSHYKKNLSEFFESRESEESLQTIADQLVLGHYTPACMLVTDQGDILYTVGKIGKYLETTTLKSHWNIHEMAREGLRNMLPAALRKAKRNVEAVVYPNIVIDPNDTTFKAEVKVQCIEKPDAIKGTFIIILSEPTSKNNSTVLDTNFQKKASIKETKHLKMELQKAYEDLQNSYEELLDSEEERKQINQRLFANNEKLQSINEELSTTKEEMQSINEELQTVNLELNSKMNDLIYANHDMVNLLNNTEIAILYLDEDLCIRRFTDSLQSLIKIRLSDIGRPFSDVKSKLIYPLLNEHCHKVIQKLSTVETICTTTDERWIKVRIMPCSTPDDTFYGLLITFLDVTTTKKLELELEAARKKLKEVTKL